MINSIEGLTTPILEAKGRNWARSSTMTNLDLQRMKTLPATGQTPPPPKHKMTSRLVGSVQCPHKRSTGKFEKLLIFIVGELEIVCGIDDEKSPLDQKASASGSLNMPSITKNSAVALNVSEPSKPAVPCLTTACYKAQYLQPLIDKGTFTKKIDTQLSA